MNARRRAGAESPPVAGHSGAGQGGEWLNGGAVSRLEARRGRVEVHLDGGHAFSLLAEVAAGLRLGQHLDAEDLAKLQAEDAYRQALNRALAWLGRRPRSQAEMRGYLVRAELPPAVVERVLARLAELGLLDDAAFAAWWVDSRARQGPRGRQALRHELAAKGLPRALQEEAVAELDDTALAQQAALAQARRYRGYPRPVFERRLAGFLARRGFSSAAIRPAVEAAWTVAGEASPTGT